MAQNINSKLNIFTVSIFTVQYNDFYYFTLIKQKIKLALVFQNDFLDLMILQQIINSGSDGDRGLKIDAQLDPTFLFRVKNQL